MLHIHDITVRLNQKIIIEHVSFEVKPGEIIGLVGPNGGGKSTLLKAILGLIPIQKGTISYDRKITFGYLPQRPPSSFELPITVEEALHIFHATSSKANQLLQEFNLLHTLKRPLNQLSGGELQKVFFIIALAENPDVVLLDEPSANIDSESDKQLRDLLLAEKAAGKSIIIVSHDIDSIIRLTDTIVCINQQVCCSGKTSLVVRSQEFQDLFQDQHYHHHHD